MRTLWSIPVVKARLVAAACGLSMVMSVTPAWAHAPDPSTASSALSLLPVALSITAPVALLSGGVVLTVVAVEVSARGAVLILERASDAAQVSIHLAGHASLAVGASVVVTAVAAGWILSQLGTAVLFIPNELGASLLYNERVTQ